MRNFVLLLVLASGAALAGETPPQALKTIPPLPKAASKDLDCSFGAKMQQKVAETTQREMAVVQAAGNSMSTMSASMTPEQMQALQALTDPAFTTCPIDAMQYQGEGWDAAAGQKLDARLGEIDAAKAKYDQDYCTKHSTGEMCDTDPGSAKRFNVQAAAAGTQYLKDVQPGYAKLEKLVTDCVVLRDKPVVAAAGVKGPLANLAVGANGQNWGLVGMLAESHSKVCDTAKNAASRYLAQ